MTDDFSSILGGLACAIALTTVQSACAGPTRSIDDEVELPREAIADRAQRTEDVTRRFSENLGQLASHLETIEGYNSLASHSALPGDLCRFVIVSCLNGADDSENRPPEIPERQNARGKTRPETATANSTPSDAPTFECPTPKLDILLAELDGQADDLESRTLELLGAVDAFQQQRDEVRRWLQRVERVIDSNRNVLAERRAEFRQRRDELRERRSDFSRAEWRDVQSKLDAYRKSLTQLQEATNQLEQRSASWPRRLETLNRSAYFAIIRPLSQ